MLRLASVCDFEELKRVILNWRVQWSIPGDTLKLAHRVNVLDKICTVTNPLQHASDT